MKILLLTDKKNWAYHSIARSLVKYNTDASAYLKIMHIKSDTASIKKAYKSYDRVLVMGWQNYDRVKFLPKDITSVGIHSFHGWDKRRTTPDKDVNPPKQLIDTLSDFHSVNAVSQRLTSLFVRNGLSVTYTANGVDTDIFKSTRRLRPLGKTLTVGYSGSKSHDWRKGISKFILPAAKLAKVEVKLAMLSKGNHIPLDKMHKFYNLLDCYICASSSEGMSLSVLEAAASGCPIITTRCSGNTEIIKDKKTGFFVDRKVEAIVEKINILKDDRILSKMSEAVSNDIKSKWGWDKRSKKWIDFILQGKK